MTISPLSAALPKTEFISENTLMTDSNKIAIKKYLEAGRISGRYINEPGLREAVSQVACGICGQPGTLGNMQLDHINSRKNGGSDYVSNLQLSHSSCNQSKGSQSFIGMGFFGGN